MKINEITEMSQIIEPVTPRTADPDKNHQLFLKYKRTCEPIEQLTPEITLYEGDNSVHYVYMAVHSQGQADDERIVYLMEYERDNLRPLGDHAVQRWVWQDPKYRSQLGDLASRLFDQLIEDYFTVVADNEQTPLGRKFWLKQLHRAFQRGLKVYYADFKQEQLHQLHDASQVDHYGKYVWTTHADSQHRVFAISSRELKPTQKAPL